ncbi:MAG: NADH-quinone oxidoreductase subunit C, partial [Syntrophales bacterium]|nr:NADH-quinone oxidoreductase subunit C [Syntrophales bacterium]
MVEKIRAELTAVLKDVEIIKTPYRERGYHLALDVDRRKLLTVAEFFDERNFYLSTVLCVDYIEYLELVYFFSHHQFLCRVKVTHKLDTKEPVAPTIASVFDSASWYEREIHEFFGVRFEGHPNMTYLFLHEGIDT